jgi:hypothetical protein
MTGIAMIEKAERQKAKLGRIIPITSNGGHAGHHRVETVYNLSKLLTQLEGQC